MNELNSLLGSLVAILFAPIEGWPPQVSLIVWSAATGVIMAWVFRHTSNQAALKKVADTIRAQLFAVKLFKDDVRVLFSCQAQLLKAVGARLLHSLPPLLVLIVPLTLLLTQLARWYEFAALTPDDASIIQLQLSDSGWESHKNVTLRVPESIAVETDALRDEQLKTVYWRIRPKTRVPATVSWQLAEQLVEKQLSVADNSEQLVPVSVRRPGAFWFDRLLYPGEPGFSANSLVRGIEVQHPHRSTPFFGVDIPWWLTFFIISMLAAVAAKPWLRVQF
jgi:hypothetical protein